MKLKRRKNVVTMTDVQNVAENNGFYINKELLNLIQQDFTQKIKKLNRKHKIFFRYLNNDLQMYNKQVINKQQQQNIVQKYQQFVQKQQEVTLQQIVDGIQLFYDQ